MVPSCDDELRLCVRAPCHFGRHCLTDCHYFVITIGTVQRNVPHSIVSVPRRGSVPGTDIVNWSTGVVSVDDCIGVFPTSRERSYCVSYCPDWPFTIRSTLFRWGTVHNV